MQASKQIVAVAGGDLPAVQWHRRVRVAIERLERMKRATGVYLTSEMLTSAEAREIERTIDDTIAALVDEVARMPLPDEIRLALPELPMPERLAAE
ncbi:MAG: hypothetical protein JWM53_5456 [bacterium]|nr:hypothetical protein [bacterium]